MRTVYVNDQTKEFDEIPEEIIMFDRLYLKGVPYERDDEAVDKEYVDTVFKNVTIEDFVGRLPYKSYPKFDGDLINNEGENNFRLKPIVKPGEYNRLIVDSKGRVIGGESGRFSWTDEDVSTVSWNKFIWSDPGEINDIFPGEELNKYLRKSNPNIVRGDIRINNSVIDSESVVLNLNQVKERLLNSKTSLGILNRSGVTGNPFGGRPASFYHFTENESDVEGALRGIPISFNSMDEHGDPVRWTGVFPNYHIHNGYIYLIYKPRTKNKSGFLRYKLDDDGIISDEYNSGKLRPEVVGPRLDSVPGHDFNHGHNSDGFIIDNRLFVVVRTRSPNRYMFYSIMLDESTGLAIGGWEKSEYFNDTAWGYHQSWFLLEDRYYIYNARYNEMYTISLDGGGVRGRWTTVSSKSTFTQKDGNTRGVNFIRIGNYVYAFFSHHESEVLRPTPLKYYARIRVSGDQLVGGWEYIPTGIDPNNFNKSEWTYLLSTNGKVYWMWGRDLYVYEINGSGGLELVNSKPVKFHAKANDLKFTNKCLVSMYRPNSSQTFLFYKGVSGKNDYSYENRVNYIERPRELN